MSYAEVTELDEELLRHGRELYRRRSGRSNSGNDQYPSEAASNLAKEREIFLKAALQMLSEEQESILGFQSSSSSSSSSLMCDADCSQQPPPLLLTVADRPAYRIPDFFHRRATVLRSLLRQKSSDAAQLAQRVPREEGIRFGWLQKACRVGTFTSSQSKMWKPKYVELRFGEFVYYDEDDNNGASTVSPEGSGMDGEGAPFPASRPFPATEGRRHNRPLSRTGMKTIPLTTDTCICRTIKMRDMAAGECVFELSIKGSVRRIWQAASRRDRDRWVAAIHGAMARSTDSLFDAPTSGAHRPSASLGNVGGSGVGSGGGGEEDGRGVQASVEGAAAPFADDIARYCCIQAAVQSLTATGAGPATGTGTATGAGATGVGAGAGVSGGNSGSGDGDAAQQYRDFLSALRAADLQVTVPVFFVKSLSGVSGSQAFAGMWLCACAVLRAGYCAYCLYALPPLLNSMSTVVILASSSLLTMLIHLHLRTSSPFRIIRQDLVTTKHPTWTGARVHPSAPPLPPPLPPPTRRHCHTHRRTHTHRHSRRSTCGARRRGRTSSETR